ncbi:MAG TPA: hypothetical protein VKR61_08385 [Bryobacteraceae bacterium]|nr:hypothetical protein [Bryobacteraceae bacterium]
MKLVIAAFLIAAATVAFAAENASLAGKWNLHYNISGYDGNLDCTFDQKDKDVTGTCKSSDGTVSVTGKVDDKAVTLQYKTQYNGDDLTIVYTGKLESAAKFAGTVTVQPMGADGEFTATQSK